MRPPTTTLLVLGTALTVLALAPNAAASEECLVSGDPNNPSSTDVCAGVAVTTIGPLAGSYVTVWVAGIDVGVAMVSTIDENGSGCIGLANSNGEYIEQTCDGPEANDDCHRFLFSTVEVGSGC
jgi:hypothetical protein